MNIDLVGQLRAELDHVPVITITRISIDESIPGSIRKGGYGVIGAARGIEDGSGTFTMTVPKTGVEIDLEGLKSRTFTLAWSDGPTRKLASGCVLTKIGRSNDPGTGSYDISCSFIYGEMLTL